MRAAYTGAVQESPGPVELGDPLVGPAGHDRLPGRMLGRRVVEAPLGRGLGRRSGPRWRRPPRTRPATSLGGAPGAGRASARGRFVRGTGPCTGCHGQRRKTGSGSAPALRRSAPAAQPRVGQFEQRIAPTGQQAPRNRTGTLVAGRRTGPSLYGTRSALVEGDLGAEPAAFTCCATRSRSAPPRHDYASPAGHASPSSAAECARPATMPPFARDATVRLVGRDNAVGEWV